MIPESELTQAQNAISQFGGYLDTEAITKWYKLDKDIRIFNEKSKSGSLLSFKSKLIEVMPALPKITRLFISQEEGSTNYEFTSG